LIERATISPRTISFSSFITARPTRSPSRSAISSGSGSPVVAISALPASERASVFCHSGAYVSASSGPSSIIALRTCWSR
jgi:hypothetical protein